MKSSQRHSDINRLKKFFREIGLPFTAHCGTAPAPADWRFPGIWLEPDGLHFFQGHRAVSPGRLAHESGHWALMSPDDRARVKPGCLSELGIDTMSDMAVECWSVAAAMEAGVEVENLFTDLEDYQSCMEAWCDDMFALRYGLKFLTGKHVGIPILQAVGMTTDDYPKMTKWLADEKALASYREVRAEAENLVAKKVLTKGF